jgi:hypothetical protein
VAGGGSAAVSGRIVNEKSPGRNPGSNAL